MGVFDDAFGDGDVFFKRKLGAVYHNRGEAAVDTGYANFEVFTVVEVDADRQTGVLDGGFDEFHEVNMSGVFAGTRGHLEDKRGLLFFGGVDDALDNLHVVDVEGAYGIFPVGFLELFPRGY